MTCACGSVDIVLTNALRQPKCQACVDRLKVEIPTAESPPPLAVEDRDGGEDHLVEAVLRALASQPGPSAEEPGWAVLEVVLEFLCRFVTFPSKAAAYAVSLWVVHTHALDAAESTPRLSITSAEMRSGKSRLLELLELLVARPLFTPTLSASVLFRQVESEHPTLLVDEVDTIFTKGGADDRNEELRALLNAGHRRGAKAYRCGGPRMTEVKAYDAFAAVALAGIGKPPSTVSDRAIELEMKRRRSDEKVQRFRRRKVVPEAEAVRKRVETWSASHVAELATAEPALPDELDDRAADGWEPLLAIAEAAGGHWPERARKAAVELSAGRTAEEDTIGVRLLADVAKVFTDVDRLASADLAGRLAGLEEAPWAEWKKGPPPAPLDARGLARRLKPYGIEPKQVRFGDRNLRGYERCDFVDAWARYCPPKPAAKNDSPIPDGSESDSGPLQPLHRRSEAISVPLQASEQLPLETTPDLP